MKTIAERLKAARDALGLNQIQLAAAAGVSPGTIGNIESGTRKNPRELLAIAAAVRVNPLWLKAGRGPRDVSTTHTASAGVEASHPLTSVTIPPSAVDWGDLMRDRLPAEFETTLQDNAMAPPAPKGARVIFLRADTCEPAEPGDWVLVFDRDGAAYLREYRRQRPGRWEAHAVNPAFLPLDSERDGLVVAAIYDGMRGRRAPR